MVTVETRRVYAAKTKGRAYLTKNAAIHQETMAIIRRKYPTEKFEPDTGHSFDVVDMDGFDKIYRRMRRLVVKSIN